MFVLIVTYFFVLLELGKVCYSSNNVTQVKLSNYLKRNRNLNEIHAFYFVSPNWDVFTDEGDYFCGDIKCIFRMKGSVNEFKEAVEKFQTNHANSIPKPLSVAVYNYKSWWEQTSLPSPPLCGVRTDFNNLELMEAVVRTQDFLVARKHYDGDTSTHPSSSIQRFYPEAYLHQSLLLPVKSHSQLIAGGTFISSNCEPLTDRLQITEQLRSLGIQIDGLGRCLRTDYNLQSPVSSVSWQDWEALMLPGVTVKQTRLKKRKMMNHYMFHLAFENTYEDGYVTEKLFDSLLAGSIPIYLGDSKMARRLLSPEVERSVIFLDDFKKVDARADAVIDQETLDTVRLVRHMKEIMDNSTRFEEMWSWRKGFSSTEYQKNHALLSKSWQCRVCEWGSDQYQKKMLLDEIRKKRSKKVGRKMGRRAKNCTIFSPNIVLANPISTIYPE